MEYFQFLGKKNVHVKHVTPLSCHAGPLFYKDVDLGTFYTEQRGRIKVQHSQLEHAVYKGQVELRRRTVLHLGGTRNKNWFLIGYTGPGLLPD